MIRSTLSTWRDWREFLTPISHVSSFKKTGEITPEEFVEAGDYLVYRFPTWSWGSAHPSKQRDFLPSDKQVLVTKHVPSHRRAAAYDTVDELQTNEDGWVATGSDKGVTPGTETATTSEEDNEEQHSDKHPQDIEEILDIDDLEEEDLKDDDDAVYTSNKYASATKSPTRSYNLYITYSTSYRVPKFYLSGFNEDGSPLKPDEMFEDINGDYKDKTVTIEKAPFEEDLTLISIHPCKHANVMRILLDRAEARLRAKLSVDNLEITKGVADLGLAEPSSSSSLSSATAEAKDDPKNDGDDWEEIANRESLPSTEDTTIRVDQYLIIFLKFIASVTPGIELDFTMAL